MKNIIITGASSGIGKATALHFAANHWNVIATMISLEEGKDLQNRPNIHCYLLDVLQQKAFKRPKKK